VQQTEEESDKKKTAKGKKNASPKKSAKAKKAEEEATLAIVEPHEKVLLTDASIMDMINHYCGHEASVRNLRKAIDRVIRKIVSKLEISDKKSTSDSTAQAEEGSLAEVQYQINTQNLEKFLDIAPTDDAYFVNINK